MTEEGGGTCLVPEDVKFQSIAEVDTRLDSLVLEKKIRCYHCLFTHGNRHVAGTFFCGRGDRHKVSGGPLFERKS